MNKRAYIFYLVILVCGFIVAFSCGDKISRKNPVYSNLSDSDNRNEGITPTEGYWVKAQDNKILVFKNDGETIIAETDIELSEFSIRETKILEKGIYLETAEELFKYLEANTS